MGGVQPTNGGQARICHLGEGGQWEADSCQWRRVQRGCMYVGARRGGQNWNLVAKVPGEELGKKFWGQERVGWHQMCRG